MTDKVKLLDKLKQQSNQYYRLEFITKGKNLNYNQSFYF
jgi:hypothetical protein